MQKPESSETRQVGGDAASAATSGWPVLDELGLTWDALDAGVGALRRHLPPKAESCGPDEDIIVAIYRAISDSLNQGGRSLT